MEQAIKHAVEGGWKPKGLNYIRGNSIRHPSWIIQATIKNSKFAGRYFLDPLFWQALGKAEGWRMEDPFNKENTGVDRAEAWLHYWHRFIDHLAEGKDAESFFVALLK